jgi:hypothetical protein
MSDRRSPEPLDPSDCRQLELVNNERTFRGSHCVDIQRRSFDLLDPILGVDSIFDEDGGMPVFKITLLAG